MDIINDCKKYLGVHPYDNWANIIVGDAYFYADMCKTYGEQNVVKTIKAIKEDF